MTTLFLHGAACGRPGKNSGKNCEVVRESEALS